MASLDQITAKYAARPWAQVADSDLAPGLAVPSMLHIEESQLYHWLGRQVQGDGATVDLGAYAGGSAARLLSGLALSGRGYHLHAYDHFRSSRKVWAKFLPNEPLPDHDDADILPLVQRYLAPWRAHVTLHPGDIEAMPWGGDPIEILAVDAAKGSAIADHVAATFFPALVPGRSVVVHQDYLMPIQPWLPAQMVMLADHFLPLTKVARDCVAFLCIKQVTAEALLKAETDVLSDGELIRRVRRAAEWHEAMIPFQRFRAMIQRVKDFPGLRLAWQFREAERARNAAVGG